jgi:hypothetical protein
MAVALLKIFGLIILCLLFGTWLLCDFIKVLRVTLKVFVTDKANYCEISVLLFAVGFAAK